MKMEQTAKIKCPNCNVIQEEDIDDLAVDAGDMQGIFKHICDQCESEFTIEFEYKPFLKTY